MKVLDADGDGVITKSEFQQLQVPVEGLGLRNMSCHHLFYDITVVIASDTLHSTGAEKGH